MTLFDSEQLPEMDQKMKDRYVLVSGTSLSRGDMAKDGDHAFLASGLCAVISRIWTGSTRVKVHTMQSVKPCLPSKAERAAAERKMVRDSAACGLSSSSASEKSGQEEGVR